MMLMFKKLAASSFVRSVVTVASGAAGAKMLTMLFAPFLTRLYGAEAFGVLGTFAAVLGILVPIAALAYPIAIILPKSDNEARGVVRLSFLIAACISSLSLVLFLLAGEPLASALSLETISDYFIFIPFALFFTASEQIIQQWLIRKKHFKVIARVTITQSFILNIFKTVAGLFYPFGITLIFLSTIGNALYAFQLWLGSKKSCSVDDRIEQALPHDVNLKKLAKKYYDFPIYRAPQQFLNGISQSLPILMLAGFFGPASAGFYTLAKTVMAVPSALIGKAVGDVFYPRISEAAHNKENLFNLLLKATFALATVGFFPFMFVIVLGPWLFSFVFGEEWVIAGEYARWMSVWMFFMFINPPCNRVIPVLNIQKFYLYFTFFSIFLRIVALAVGSIIFKSDMAAVVLFCITGALVNILIISIVLFRSRNFYKGSA